MVQLKPVIEIQGVAVPKCPMCLFARAMKRRVAKPAICWCGALKVELESTVFACVEYDRAGDEALRDRIAQFNETGCYGTAPQGWGKIYAEEIGAGEKGS